MSAVQSKWLGGFIGGMWMKRIWRLFNRVKDEEQKIVVVVLEKMETRGDVEKEYHKDIPKQIKAVLRDYKDIFPTNLQPGLPLV